MAEQLTQSPEPEQTRAPGPDLGEAAEEDPYYILAPTPPAVEGPRVLKHADTFAVFDHYGDIKPIGLGEEGIYHEGTRFLSSQFLTMGKDRPLFLSSTVREDNDLLAVDLTNPDIAHEGQIVIPRGTLHIARTKFLWQGVCYERLRIRNYGVLPVESSFCLYFDADFADIFEVRGAKRISKGRYHNGVVENGVVVLAYEGLDRVVRRTRMMLTPAPAALAATAARFDVALRPREEASFDVTIACETDHVAPPLQPYDQALAAAVNAVKDSRAQTCTIVTSNEQFNDWVNRTVADLHMMVTDKSTGPYPYAGVPWFSTPFGRDGIITALECLWLNPALARGVLAYLAATQAREVNSEQDAEPGKILHETRSGEMASLGEVPFGLYYGSVDATPLFIVLAGAYLERTADRSFIESIWPNLEAALNWIDNYGDRNGGGFVEYIRHSPQGLVHQGWKDSHDAVFHQDGTLAHGPIALCEVQGYVYAAKVAAAEMTSVLGNKQRGHELVDQARALQARFEQSFWCEDVSTYAIALDGANRACKVRTSNAGHCLFAGIASPKHAHDLARTLLSQESFSGWGIRTVSASEVRYNPMSYHNGSVWPHDNAVIAYGLSRYNLKEQATKILAGLFDASVFLDLHRLPELFCGFPRRPGEGPTLYPVACSPQAWSAGAVFLLLQACLGLSLKGAESQICFSYPVLPPFLEEVQIRNLRVGEASVDLLLRRHGHDVGINVLRREGQVEIRMVK